MLAARTLYESTHRYIIITRNAWECTHVYRSAKRERLSSRIFNATALPGQCFTAHPATLVGAYGRKVQVELILKRHGAELAEREKQTPAFATLTQALSVTHFEFNKAYVAFRLANWVRTLVATLCSPKGESVTFPKMADTVVDQDFIEFCRGEFRRVNDFQPDDDAPSYVSGAEAKVAEALEACRNETVASVQEPMKQIEAGIIPILLGAVRGAERELQQRTGKTLDVLELEIRRIARQPPWEAGPTVSTFWDTLRQIGVLPVQQRPSEPPAPGTNLSARDIATKHALSLAPLEQRLRRWRQKNLDGGWIEDANPRRGKAKYLYDENAVWHIIQDLTYKRK